MPIIFPPVRGSSRNGASVSAARMRVAAVPMLAVQVLCPSGRPRPASSSSQPSLKLPQGGRQHGGGVVAFANSRDTSVTARRARLSLPVVSALSTGALVGLTSLFFRLWKAGKKQGSKEMRRQTSVALDDRIRENTNAMEDQPDKTTPTMRELTFPPLPSNYATNIIAGVVAGLKFTLGMVVMANIAFNSSDNRSVSALFATGININLMACSVMLLWNTVFSGFNALVAPQDVPAVVMAQLSTTIAGAVHNKANAGHTLLAAGWISTLLSGAILVLLGRLKAGDALRRLPSPVVGGFLAAMGAIAIRGAVSMLTGVPFNIFWPTDLEAFSHWRPWLHLGLGIYGLLSARYLAGFIKPMVKDKRLKTFVAPLCMLSPPFIFYAVLLCRGSLGADMTWMRSVGWMYPKIESRPFYTLWAETLRFDRVEWATLMEPHVSLSLVVLALLTALSAMLSIVSCQPCVPCASSPGELGGRVDLNKELRVLGSGQLVSGALTGVLPGFQQVGVSANLYTDGGTHRLAEFTAASFVLLVFVSGVPVSPYVPKFFLGAIFLNLGVSFCKTHLYDTWGKMSGAHYCSMLVIVLVGLARGLTSAVAVGIVIQTVLMVQQASAVDPVYQCGSSDGGFISARIRSMKDARRLRWSRSENTVWGKLEVVRLQGPLFFGVAPTLEDGVEALLRTLPALTHFILDFTRVTQVDDSGSRAVASIIKSATGQGVLRVAITGASPGVEEALKIEVAEDQRDMCLLRDDRTTPAAELFPTLEEAIEIYEDDLLSGGRGEGEVVRAKSALVRDWLKPGGLSDEEWQVVQHASSETLDLADGQQLSNFGDKVDGLWILVRGCINLETYVAGGGGEERRVVKTVAKYVAPFTLHNAAYLMGAEMHAFSARALGPTGATVLWLRQADLTKLEADSPAVYTSFIGKCAGYSLAVESVHSRWRSARTE